MAKPTPNEIPANEWIRPSTWSLIDKKASLSREGRLHQRVRRKLVREIKGSLKDDRRHRTKAVGEKIVGLLDAGELAEAWGTLKGWYTAASERSPNPCYAYLAKQTAKREGFVREGGPSGQTDPDQRRSEGGTGCLP